MANERDPMATIKTFLVRLGLWLAACGDYVPPPVQTITKIVQETTERDLAWAQVARLKAELASHRTAIEDHLKEIARVKAVTQVEPTLSEAAHQHVIAQEAEEPRPGHGELKRHRVFGKLINDFPEATRHDIGMAIEEAVRKHRHRL